MGSPSKSKKLGKRAQQEPIAEKKVSKKLKDEEYTPEDAQDDDFVIEDDGVESSSHGSGEELDEADFLNFLKRQIENGEISDSVDEQVDLSIETDKDNEQLEIDLQELEDEAGDSDEYESDSDENDEKPSKEMLEEVD